MKILTVVGARPQFIKAAAVSREMARRPNLAEVLVHTGQHYDDNMSRVFFDELEIPKPAHNLGVGSGGHGEQTGRMLVGLERLIGEERPDWVMVYGDTNSTLAGALAAVKLHVPVAHVEAGLRSFNRRMPEEVNRVLTDHVSSLLFCPTETAVRHLQTEGLEKVIDGGKLVGRDCSDVSGPDGKPVVLNVGDVMYDSILFYLEKLGDGAGCLERFGVAPQRYCLVTVHRGENTDDPQRLREILAGLARVGEHVPIVWPVHPRTRRLLDGADLGQDPARIHLVAPVGYLDCLVLERNARVVLTDSGGVQKEAYLLDTPCITLRDETEWVETVESGANVLVGASAERIASAYQRLDEMRPNVVRGLFGDGRAGERIVGFLS